MSHETNFIESMRSRKDPQVPVEVGHHSNTVCILGNIAFELKRPVKWNPQTQSFINDGEAASHLHRPYRDGYSLT
ncbi:hypothetical protein [Rhodocytophaga rosea]|uniref:hypothetical protein n=1 Tax=Rhodocytophaga rosea TaxID=2704465 RepID=UPI0021CFCA50|nr:hypothetical protein [Rhodocytophaga rosea]